MPRRLLQWVPKVFASAVVGWGCAPPAPKEEPVDSATTDTAACASPSCNGEDDDCDGVVDEPGEPATPVWYPDQDGDGYGDPALPVAACDPPPDHVADATDCDDTRADRAPGLPDPVGDGIDQDCDGADAACDPGTGPTRPLDGDLTLVGSAATEDAARFCLDHDGLTGTLLLDDVPWTDLSALPCLCGAGALHISESALTTLDGLPARRTLGRDISFTDTVALASTAGLSGTTWIPAPSGTDALVVRRNAVLTDLSGFDGFITADLVQLRDLPALGELTGLPDLNRVLESLEVRDNAQLHTISGLTALTTADELRIEGNPQLSSLPGLSTLDHVRYLTLGDNALDNLGDFASLSSIEARLTVRDASRLTALSGLTGLHTLGGLRLEDNDALSTFAGLADAAGAQGIGGTVHIHGHPAVDSLDGLDWVQWIDGDLELGDDESTTRLSTLSGLDNLAVITGQVVIENTPRLANLTGLGALTHAGGLRIDGRRHPDTQPFSLSGLDTLTTLAGPLELRSLPTLEDLDGLAGLTTAGTVLLQGNPALLRLTGLEDLRETGDLIVIGNPLLLDISALYGVESTTGVCLEVPGDPAEPDAFVAATGAAWVCP